MTKVAHASSTIMQVCFGFKTVEFSKRVNDWLKIGTKMSVIKVKKYLFWFLGPRIIQQRKTKCVAFLHRDQWTT